MPTLEFETLVHAPLERVWEFFEDVTRALPALSPPASDVSVESADLPVRAGSRIVIRARGPLGMRIRWVARIVEHRPPPAATSGDAALSGGACFVDDQESGPFAAWRHTHGFAPAGDAATRVGDGVTYRPPFGPLGWLADVLLIRRQLRAMFRYRHEALARQFPPQVGGVNRSSGQPE